MFSINDISCMGFWVYLIYAQENLILKNYILCVSGEIDSFVSPIILVICLC